MKLTITAGYINFTFEENDWKNIRGGAQAIIRDLKSNVPHSLKDKDGWMYNPDDKTWTLKDTPKNRTTIEGLKKQYLDDPRELSLPFESQITQ